MERRFAGKVALATGATTRIGQEAAVCLVPEGSLVDINRRSELDADETMELIKAAGGKGFAVAAQMRDPDAAKVKLADVGGAWRPP